MFSRFALEGWKWFVYFFFSWNFPKYLHPKWKRERNLRKFSYQSIERSRSGDNMFRLSRVQTFINAKIRFRVLRFTTARDDFTRMKDLNSFCERITCFRYASAWMIHWGKSASGCESNLFPSRNFKFSLMSVTNHADTLNQDIEKTVCCQSF